MTVALDPARGQPLYLQLASAIAEDIRRGRLKPGEALPGSRELADSLNVSRNTVVAAYGELAAEGLVNTRIGGGTFVARLPSVPTSPRTPAGTRPTYALPPSALPPISVDPPPPGALVFSRSMPDVRLLPARQLARAVRRAISERGLSVLSYTDPRGHVRLRTELAAMLTRTRGMLCATDDVLITRSIEQGLDMVARTLIAPGDTVVVEAFGYPPGRRVFRLAGARLLPVAVDEDGLDVDALESLVAHEHIRAVLLSPHHQFPTTVVMSAARRERLAKLALAYRFAIIEDDYDHEFHYEGKPVLPIAAGSARANVIYVASMSNLLAPGLSTGFIAAPRQVMQRLIALRAASDTQGDAAVECALAELFEDGELLRHVRRMRRLYAVRRDALAAALVKHLGSAVDFHLPEGGMALWVRAAEDIDVAAWARAGEHEGVLFKDARAYDFFHGEQPFLRLGFSYHDPAELEEGVRRMSRALVRTRTSSAPMQTADAAKPGKRHEADLDGNRHGHHRQSSESRG
ncbi:MAG: PLP-dependent aminotransferase family protein [Gammaproteobacteria bacterium]